MPRRDRREKLEADNAALLAKSRSARDVAGDYPGPGDLATRRACALDLRRFLDAYFPNAFNLAWSDDHLRAIDRLQDIILNGGLFALAMPRGSGKSTICERAALWAVLYGHRRFVCLVGATEGLARKILEHMKTELAHNDRLAADFRQACHPIRRLENNGRKAIGQLFEGEQTRITWGKDRLTLPTMPDSACDGANVSGSTVSVGGLTGALRGQSHTLADGTVIRPELVILDDPQTRESAMSSSQSETRAAIVEGDVLGMAGPGKKIAAVMPCTVIRNGDMADLMLDRKGKPEWGGHRTRMVYAFPNAAKLWDEYAQLRADGLEADRGGAEATEFYRRHRAEMDAGSRVAWPERFEPDDLSAIQHAMNLKLRNARAFQAEYQNDPLPEHEPRPDDLTPDQVAAKLNRRRRGEVPGACHRLTAFVDVHAAVLYYVVAAWEDSFSGYVVDYGTYPDQKSAYFTLRDAKNTLATAFPAAGTEGRIYAGLEALTGALLSREWVNDLGANLRVDRCLIDANWGTQTNLVYQFCRQSAHAAVITPSHGKYFGAGNKPLIEYEKRPGERAGHYWRISNTQGRRAIRKVMFDTNFWKSFVLARLNVAMGDRGCLSLFGDKPDAHRLFADHLCAEYRQTMKLVKNERVVDEWHLRPERPDNHWLDCLVGCAVAASMEGAALPEATAEPTARPKRVSFADLQRQRRA